MKSKLNRNISMSVSIAVVNTVQKFEKFSTLSKFGQLTHLCTNFVLVYSTTLYFSFFYRADNCNANTHVDSLI